MKVVLLCGGQGIRAFPFTTYLPKPMLPLGGTPVIVHVIKSFIAQGFREFVLAAGYRKSVLDDYFEGKNLGCSIEIVDTGDEADTGSRIFNARHFIEGDLFIATYGDGLSDVPMNDVVAFHRNHGKLATITSVPMYSQYGVLTVGEGGRVDSFVEKPLIDAHWINAGFMVFRREIFNHWQGDNLEREVLPRLIEQGQVHSYCHPGFFKSFDSYKDVVEMDETIAQGGILPWVARREDAA